MRYTQYWLEVDKLKIMKNKYLKWFWGISLTLLLNISVFAQDRFTTIEGKLNDLAKNFPGLDEKVKTSVNGLAIQDFIRGLAEANNLNISVDPALKVNITQNFTNVTVTDVLVFLCRKYDLDISFVGSIMSVSQYTAPAVEIPKPKSKNLIINYDSSGDKLSVDLKNDTLYAVTKEIAKKTGKNIIYSPEISNNLISGYIQNTPLQQALEMIAISNNLIISVNEQGYFVIEKKDAQYSNNGNSNNIKPGNNKSKNSKQAEGLKIENNGGLLNVDANNVPISDIINNVSAELNKNYFLFNEPKGNATFTVKNSTYEDLLTNVLNGSDYTFKKDGEIFLIGERAIEKIRSTRVFQFKYRTAEKVIDLIPSELKKGVDIKPFLDINSLIISGSTPRIEELENFLRDIDRVVPNIAIEVIVVDVSNSKTLATKLEAGLSKGGKKTEGQLYPSIDMSLSSSSINNILSGISGISSVVLGKVTPDFYVNLKLLEEQGILKQRSTPKLATLNGHEASLSIGRTEYYLEVQNQVIGGVNNTVSSQQQYKSVNADLSVKINPIVSGDDQITLDIQVKQSNFTARIAPTAPPGTVTRDFKSLIRVKNEEMILLGGLEEDVMNDAGSGLPVLSRIPVIKWLFSSRTKSRKKAKLNIFIKPIVIYN